jgi:integrase/recombinase XerD
MATVNIIYYTSVKNNNGSSPIVIRVIDNRQVKKRTFANVLPNQWDEDKNRVIPRSHPNYAAINIQISGEYNRIEELILSNKFDLKRDFVDYFKKESGKEVKAVVQLNFRQIADLYLAPLVLKSGYTYSTYTSIIKKFLGCVGEGIRLSEITDRHINKWIAFMQEEKNKESTIHTNIKVVRFVSAFAQKNHYDTKPEALHNFRASVGTKRYKVRLTETEFQAIRDVELTEGSKLPEIRDMFLLAVYLRGVRISDLILLKQSYIVNGRIKYRTEKTGKDFDIKLRPEAMEIIDRYKDGREYLFSFYSFVPSPYRTDEKNEIERVQHIKSITSNINGKLNRIASKANIEKKISSHIARHTFARMALDKIKDTNVTMDLLGHTNMKVHEAYIREITRSDEMDDAADKIFS